VSIFLGLAVGVEKWAIPDTPRDAIQGVERQRWIENILVLGAHLDMDEEQAPKQDEEIPEFAFNPTKDFVDMTEIPLIPLGDLTRLSNETSP